MNTTIRGHNLRARMTIALLAVVLLVAVVFAVWSTSTTSDRDGNPAIHTKSAGGAGASNLRQDLIDQHLKMVERLNDDSLR